MTLKSDPKFEEKLTCSLENFMRNLTKFYLSTRKSQNWDFEDLEDLCLMTLRSDA